jgi:nitrogen-specific signal transduction histidine kinase
MTEFKIPTIDIPGFDAEKVVDFAKDAFYVTVGLGVLGVQKAQVRRTEFMSLVTERMDASKTQLDELRQAVEARFGALDERVQLFETKLDTVVEQVKDRLPAPAGDALVQAHEAAKAARTQVRSLLVKAA